MGVSSTGVAGAGGTSGQVAHHARNRVASAGTGVHVGVLGSAGHVGLQARDGVVEAATGAGAAHAAAGVHGSVLCGAGDVALQVGGARVTEACRQRELGGKV
jgi:hypothetical protein